MNRDDINYWMSQKFDHVPPTDEEMNSGTPITKPQLARILAGEIRSMVASNFPLESVMFKVDQLARMVKDEPEEEPEDGSDE